MKTLSAEASDEEILAVVNAHKGYIWFDLPLNGRWSDLTAVLTFRVINQRVVIELESIEVM